MKNSFLGIDIGTSSVKVLLLFSNGKIIKYKESYSSVSIDGWTKALKRLLKKFRRYDISAIAFSSQVGTYVLDDKTVLPWNTSAGKEQLDYILSKCEKDEFTEEISMNHPKIISYPLPRYLYIKENYPLCKKVCMPKDYFIERFTGNYVTDVFSMRGIANIEKKEYSKNLLDKFSISFDLPKIVNENDICGYVTESAHKEFYLKKGTPVYAGCNDFFAGLLGMGVIKEDQVFDVSGTSEHLGVITKDLVDTQMVSGPFFVANATYGGTKASGVSCKFAIENFSLLDVDFERELSQDPPIFLPYLTGERAPIFDEDARGVFFGISDKTNNAMLAYSVLEGVLFSLYDIALNLGVKEGGKLICGGGSSVDKVLTQMKAELFNKDIVNVVENDTSALGAALIAMKGSNFVQNYAQAVEIFVKYHESVKPIGKYRDKLIKRFNVYRSIYKSLRKDFKEFKEI